MIEEIMVIIQLKDHHNHNQYQEILLVDYLLRNFRFHSNKLDKMMTNQHHPVLLDNHQKNDQQLDLNVHVVDNNVFVVNIMIIILFF